MTSMTEEELLVNRREAIRRVSALLGGIAFVGGSSLITACENAPAQVTKAPGTFSAADVAFLDEIADTILPDTKTPGAKTAKTGAFMALMVTDTYSPRDQRAFRDGMKKVDDATKKAYKASFMSTTPQQRLAVLTALDREAKTIMDARDAAVRRKKGLAPVKTVAAKQLPGGAGKADAYLPDERKENAPGADASAAAAISADEPAHYFRMMKELALLGYFTSEVGCTKAQRYVESPGRFDPCAPYKPGETAWAAHA